MTDTLVRVVIDGFTMMALGEQSFVIARAKVSEKGVDNRATPNERITTNPAGKRMDEPRECMRILDG